MKQLLLGLVLIATLVLVGVPAADVTYAGKIGLYADEAATVCYSDFGFGPPTHLYIYATLEPVLIDVGITAVEFKIDNLPVNDMINGMVSVVPTSEVVVGNVYTDYSVAWQTPQGVDTGIVLVADCYFSMYAPGWVGTNHLMQVVEGEDCNCIALVDDEFVAHDGFGDSFWGNCTVPDDCQCLEIPSAATESSWSDVKSLY